MVNEGKALIGALVIILGLSVFLTVCNAVNQTGCFDKEHKVNGKANPVWCRND